MPASVARSRGDRYASAPSPAGGFEGLARVIVGQQLSVANAAIWERLDTGLSPFSPCSLLRVSERDLRRAGLSAAKIANHEVHAGTVIEAPRGGGGSSAVH
jgi:3-methyladenine DNA glycosylase/8-oxoguanine DNA glycosylase